MEVDMGRTKRKKKKTKKLNTAALIVAVILTALVIFFVRGGFTMISRLIFNNKVMLHL
jgi:hypothetical protein